MPHDRRAPFSSVLLVATLVGGALAACGSDPPRSPGPASGGRPNTGGAPNVGPGGGAGVGNPGASGGRGGGAETGIPPNDGAAPPTPTTDGASAETPSPTPTTDGAAEMPPLPAPDAGGPGPTPGPPSGAPPPGDYGTRAPLLERNSEFAMAALDGKVYVLGGYPTNPSQTRPTLQIYDPATNSWRLGAPAPSPVHHPMLAGVNGKLYSLGGQPNTNVVLEYDPAANSWRPRARMPSSRGGGATAVLGAKIYVVGARPPVAPEAGNAFEVYDTAADSWDTLPALPNRFPLRNHLAAAGIGGKVYVAGGRYNDCCVGAPMTAALEMFDPATETWTAKANMLRPRGGVAGVAANGCFHVYGGEGANIGEPNGVFPDHDVYNPVTDKWTALKKLPIPFHGVTGGAFVDGVIYMPGGGTASGGSSGTVMHQTYRPNLACQ